MIRGSVMNSMRTGARARADQSSRRGLYAEPSLADLTDAWAHACGMDGGHVYVVQGHGARDHGRE